VSRAHAIKSVKKNAAFLTPRDWGQCLALVGVFGIISFSVSQRTNEIGIRMAMGAAQASILRMILRQGVWIISAGLISGIALALAISRLVSNSIAGVSPYDPLTYVSVTTILGIVALLACYLPRESMR